MGETYKTPERISQFITWNEATKSSTAIKFSIANQPTEDQFKNMRYTGLNLFDPLRLNFGIPIGITSMFRSQELNEKIGGAKSSQHLANNGAAIDIDADMYGGVSNIEIFNYIKDHLVFDQLIAEFIQGNQPAWIHVSLKQKKNRNEILIATKQASNTIYIDYTNEIFNIIYG